MIAILFLFVFPTRSFLAQRGAVNDARHDVQVMHEQNERLAAEAKRLQTPAEIERMAREQYHYVYPGEQAYSVDPRAPPRPRARRLLRTARCALPRLAGVPLPPDGE